MFLTVIATISEKPQVPRVPEGEGKHNKITNLLQIQPRSSDC